jgi:hypothetical protein
LCFRPSKHKKNTSKKAFALSLTQMDQVFSWLDANQKRIARANDLRQTNPSQVPPPVSFMSHFPELILPLTRTDPPIEDAELNPMKLYEFSSRGGGVGTILKQVFFENRPPKDRPFTKFSEKEMQAAFSFPTIIKSTESAPPNAVPPPATTTTTTTVEANKKRTYTAAAATTAPVNNAIKRSRMTSPALPPVEVPLLNPVQHPPLPPRAASPPLPPLPREPSPQPPLPSTTTATTTMPPPLPPLPNKTPPPPLPPPLPLAKQPSISKLPNNTTIKIPKATTDGGVNEDGENDDSSTSHSDLELDITPEQGQVETTSALKSQLLHTVNALIDIKNWPRPAKTLVSQFKTRGYPSGNPFAVVLKRNCGFVPETYFDVIEKPLDLTTIKERVLANFYLTSALFELDIDQVVKNAKQYNVVPGPLKVMAEFLEQTVENELLNLKHRLTRTSI